MPGGACAGRAHCQHNPGKHEGVLVLCVGDLPRLGADVDLGGGGGVVAVGGVAADAEADVERMFEIEAVSGGGRNADAVAERVEVVPLLAASILSRNSLTAESDTLFVFLSSFSNNFCIDVFFSSSVMSFALFFHGSLPIAHGSA